MTETKAAHEYLIRALTYAASFGLTDPIQCATMTGKDVADFLVNAVSYPQMQKHSFLLYGVQSALWWRVLTRLYKQLGDLDEMRVKEALEAGGYWYWGVKPVDPVKQQFCPDRFNRLYSQHLVLHGWMLIRDQQHLRKIVDRVNGQRGK